MEQQTYWKIAVAGLLWILAYSFFVFLGLYYGDTTLIMMFVFGALAATTLFWMWRKYNLAFYSNLIIAVCFLLFLLLDFGFSYNITLTVIGWFAELLYYFVLCHAVFICAEPEVESFVFWQISLPLSFLMAIIPIILVIVGTWKSKPLFKATK